VDALSVSAGSVCSSHPCGCRRVLGAVQAGILNMSGDETD